MTRLYMMIAAAGLATTGASFFVGKWLGYNNGVDHEQAVQEKARLKTQQALFELGENLSRKAAELETLKQGRKSHVQSLEAKAMDAVGAGRPGVGVGGLRRIEQRWSSP